MESRSAHTFHVPVMGTAFSIDTPLRVARYGLSSVVSLVDEVLIEQMRKYHCEQSGEHYIPIADDEEDSRARRITAYLDLLDRLVKVQVRELQASPFEEGSEITRYFELLPDSPVTEKYRRMLTLGEGPEKASLQEELRALALPGSIDVNIMTKLDRIPYRNGAPMGPEHSEAISGLRGYARSGLRSSIVFSAGMNPRLYSHAASFDDFFGDEEGELRKKIVLKVSDYRSADIQGKFLAKRGLWVSEFRIESGINCGGHAFPTNGVPSGPILHEFKENRQRLVETQHRLYCKSLSSLGRAVPGEPREQRITVQGGIGEAFEDRFLLDYYQVDGTGWGTPFMFCPEVTTVDEKHLRKLTEHRASEIFLSRSSPLGVPFWNLYTSASEERRRERIAEGRPGSACPKGHLKFDTEYTKMPVCGASRAYQKIRLEKMPPDAPEEAREAVLAKSCICHDLAGSATVAYGIDPEATPAICCGPNVVNFRKVASLEEMVGHIYGRLSLLTTTDRPHMFVSEMRLYVDYLRGEAGGHHRGLARRTPKQFGEFRENLLKGVEYYRGLAAELPDERRERFTAQLSDLEKDIEGLILPAAES